MILIKTLFLNLIPEEVTVVEPEALVGVVVNLFYVFIFVYRTWIVAPAVLVVNKERLSPLATKLLPTHLIDAFRTSSSLQFTITCCRNTSSANCQFRSSRVENPLFIIKISDHVLFIGMSRMQAPSFSDASMSATSEELSSSGISSEGGSRDAISVELSSSTASI